MKQKPMNCWLQSEQSSTNSNKGNKLPAVLQSVARRVIGVEFSSLKLALPLRWSESVVPTRLIGALAGQVADQILKEK